MDNASKALVIAGSVLVSILLVATGVQVYNNAGDGVTQQTKQASEKMWEGVDVSMGLKPGDGKHEGELISTDTDCVGYYANLDNDPEPEGIIYIDKANTLSGSWAGNSYTITNVKKGLKEYYLSDEEFSGDFGPAPVVSLKSGSTGEERFYIMALEDCKKTIEGIEYKKFYWYKNASENGVDGYYPTSKIGEGKTYTLYMRNKWEIDEEKNNLDLWGCVEEGWFVPSKSEWVAFMSAVNPSDDYYNNRYYVNFKLNYSYWTSSQNGPDYALYIQVTGRIFGSTIDQPFAVRLSTIF